MYDTIELELRRRPHLRERISHMFLTEPSAQYKGQFIAALPEFHREGRLLGYDTGRLSSNFESFLLRLQNQKKRTSFPSSLVPNTEFWLIDNGEYIGYLSVRHELSDALLKVGGHIGYVIRPSKRRHGYGKEILRLGLEKARELGLHQVLVTCDENNIGSKKVIEGNGGQFENAVEVEGSPMKKLRYWIDLIE